jgi:hypothetical protein
MLVGEYSVEVLRYALEHQNIRYDHDVEVYGKVLASPETYLSAIIFRLSETRMMILAPMDLHLGDTEIRTYGNDWQDHKVAKFPMMTTSPDPITGNTVVLGMMAFKSGEEANSFFLNTKYLGELPVRATYEALQECNDEDNVILWQEETPNPRHRLHWMRLSDLKLPARSGVTAAEEILRRQNAAKNGMS